MRSPLLRQLLPPRFAWRDGNRFELLSDGERFFPHMLDAISRAQHSIALEMYLVGSGKVFAQFLQALLAAAARGVQVRILLDDFGAQQLNMDDRQALRATNVSVLFFNRLRWRKGVRNLLRNHRKLLLVDHEIAFVGGAGITDEFLYSRDTVPPWHELMLAIRGPAVNDWAMLFDRTWFGIGTRWFKQRRASHNAAVSGIQRGRVCASSGPRAHHVTQSLYQQLRNSKQRFWLATPYFLPSLRLSSLLLQAARRRVDVRVLVPGKLTDHPAIRHASRRHYARLLRGGVRIFEYQPRFIHAKLALCDGWTSIGSTNFDRWNLHWNLDANQEIDDASFALQAQQQLEQDFALSEELHYASWQQRPLYLRCLEWLNGKVDRLLDRLHT